MSELTGTKKFPFASLPPVPSSGFGQLIVVGTQPAQFAGLVPQSKHATTLFIVTHPGALEPERCVEPLVLPPVITGPPGVRVGVMVGVEVGVKVAVTVGV
ncbi:MAG TPA: hypothetical protein VMW17_11700 [Candidatus Binatia bacterium]|nr:hypothetical protein [Candidatus Binatia bacterium]